MMLSRRGCRGCCVNWWSRRAIPTTPSVPGVFRSTFIPFCSRTQLTTKNTTRLVRALVNARILLSSGADSQAILRLAHTRVLDGGSAPGG